MGSGRGESILNPTGKRPINAANVADSTVHPIPTVGLCVLPLVFESLNRMLRGFPYVLVLGAMLIRKRYVINLD